jgi:hypothetical protein
LFDSFVAFLLGSSGPAEHGANVQKRARLVQIARAFYFVQSRGSKARFVSVVFGAVESQGFCWARRKRRSIDAKV